MPWHSKQPRDCASACAAAASTAADTVSVTVSLNTSPLAFSARSEKRAPLSAAVAVKLSAGVPPLSTGWSLRSH